MSATTSQRLIVNVETGSLVPTYNGLSGSTNPRYVLGDTVPVELYLVKSTGGGAATVNAVPFPAGAVVRMAVGVVNQSPTDGTFKLAFGGDETSDLAFDISDADLETALNALPSITTAGGVTVGRVGNQYQINFVTVGDKGSFSGQSVSLFPASAVQIQTLREGSATDTEAVLVNLAVSPIALTETFSDLPEPSASYTSGSFTLSGSIKGGSFRLRLSYGQDGVTKTVWTQPILVDQTAGVISQIIFQALVNSGWGTISGNETTNGWGVTVTQLEPYSWRADFVAPVFSTAVAVVAPTIIDIEGDDVTYLPGKTAELSLATAEAIAYLSSASSRTATLEIEVQAGEVTQTILQTNCTFGGEVIVDGAFAPLTLDVPMSEAVANERFVRRDVDQTLDDTTKDQIWENLLGSDSIQGRDIAPAILGANSPSGSNAFATLADLTPAYDQSLNTTDAVNFTGVTVDGLVRTDSFEIKPGATVLFSINTDGEIATSAAASFGSVSVSGLSSTGALAVSGTGLDTSYAQDLIQFQGVSTLTPTDLSLTDGSSVTVTLGGVTGTLALTNGANTVSLDASSGVTFASTNALSDAIFSAGTNASTGKTHIDVADYPDEVQVVINGITYAMPARVV